MAQTAHDTIATILSPPPTLLPKLEASYKAIHSHPELSMQEARTAGLAERHLREAGYEVTAGVTDYESFRTKTHDFPPRQGMLSRNSLHEARGARAKVSTGKAGPDNRANTALVGSSRR
jgi:metal-dependent amidase/aminoacylase/carboxypeptidase family protein